MNILYLNEERPTKILLAFLIPEAQRVASPGARGCLQVLLPGLLGALALPHSTLPSIQKGCGTCVCGKNSLEHLISHLEGIANHTQNHEEPKNFTVSLLTRALQKSGACIVPSKSEISICTSWIKQTFEQFIEKQARSISDSSKAPTCIVRASFAPQ